MGATALNTYQAGLGRGTGSETRRCHSGMLAGKDIALACFLRPSDLVTLRTERR